MLHPFQNFVTAAVDSDVTTSKKVALIIVNPHSGKKRGPKAVLVFKPMFEKAGIECRVHETKHSGHCAEICEKEDLTGIDVIVPVGGDGTVHEACTGLMRRKDDAVQRVTVAIMPAGSGNSVAYDFNIAGVAEAAQIVIAGKYRKIDCAKLITLDDKASPLPDVPPLYSLNIAGWALPTVVMKIANSFRRYGLGAQYNYAIYKYILTNDSYKARVTYTTEDGQVHKREEKIQVFIAMNSIHLGSRMPIAPDAKLDDGLLDLVIMKKANQITSLITFSKAQKAKHTKRKQFFTVKVKDVTLEPLDKRLIGMSTVNVDGELNGITPCRIEVVPNAIRVFCKA